MESKEELIKLRGWDNPRKKSEEAFEKLRQMYEKEYKPKHSPSTYYKIIKEYNVTEIKLLNPQESNYQDMIYTTFSVASQHVRGFTKEHCLDQIHDRAKSLKKWQKELKEMPSLEKLVNSKTKIESNSTYWYKYGGAAYSVSGEALLFIKNGKAIVQYQCATCGHICLQDGRPDNTVCSGCDNPNWVMINIPKTTTLESIFKNFNN